MSGADWAILAVVVVLFLASILLAMAETAFTRMSRIRALALEEDGRKHAGKLAQMLEHPERTLNVVLLLVLIAQLTTATLIGVLLEGSAGAFGVVIGIVLQIVLFFVVGEVAPKTFAIQHTERAALAVAPVLWFLTHFPPLRWLSRGLIGIANVVLPGKGLKEGPFVTEEEIRQMADVAADEAAIETSERELIHSIFEFGDTVVREVMVPRPDMIAVEADATVDEGIALAISAGKSRLPSFDDSTDNIVGLVFLKDLVARSTAGEGSEPVRGSLRSPHYVPESKRVAELLREMQTEKFHMAIAVDEYGGTAGLLTIEDVLEEIVGEITDESDADERPEVEELDGGAVRVSSRMTVDDLGELFGIDLEDHDVETVGGLLAERLGRVPLPGAEAEVAGLRLFAEGGKDRRGRMRITSVVVHPADAEAMTDPVDRTRRRTRLPHPDERDRSVEHA